MADVRVNRREVADLIRDGALPLHCPKCAAELYLRLTDLGGVASRAAAPAAAAPVRAAPAAEEQPKCVSCGKPITAYAFAVRKGLCTECFSVSGSRLDKPGQPREPPPAEPPAAGPATGP
jgi:hypothetical protein